jgi:DNA-binding NarL/FixJ family response regulator
MRLPLSRKPHCNEAKFRDIMSLLMKGDDIMEKDTVLRILLIEDSDTDSYIIQNALRQHKKNAVCTRVATLHDGEALLQKGEADAVLLDLGLPDTPSPSDTYEQMRKWAHKIPVIIMTSLQDHELARRMVQEGAADFLNKDVIAKDPKQIQNAIDFSVARHAITRKITEESKEKDAMLNCFMGGYSVTDKAAKIH